MKTTNVSFGAALGKGTRAFLAKAKDLGLNTNELRHSMKNARERVSTDLSKDANGEVDGITSMKFSNGSWLKGSFKMAIPGGNLTRGEVYPINQSLVDEITALIKKASAKSSYEKEQSRQIVAQVERQISAQV